MKRNKLLFISFILAITYMLYSVCYWFSCIQTRNSLDILGSTLALKIILPHLVLSLLATIFNGVTLFLNNRNFALISSLFFLLALAVFPLYFIFVILQTTLCLIAFFKMKKVLIEMNPVIWTPK